MKQELISKEKNLETIKFKYENSEFEPFISQEIQKASREYQIPGFRKGKAPKGLIRKMIGEDRLKSLALEELIKNDIEETIKDKDTLMLPSIENLEFTDDKNAEVTVQIHLKPEVTLPDYKDITVDKYVPSEENIQEMINERLKQLQNENAILEPKVGKAEIGDNVRMSYVVKNEEGRELFNQEAKEYDLLEDDQRDIIQTCIGMQAGEEKEYTREFTADADGNKSGKEMNYIYNIKVEEVYNRVIPELSDDFAKEVKEVEGNTLEELKANIRQEAMEAMDETVKNSIKNQIINALVEDSEIELSDATKKEFLESAVESMKKDNSYDSELERVGSESELNDAIIDSNVYQLKKLYATSKVFKESGEEITDEMFKEYVEKMAPAWGMMAEQAMGFLEKDHNVRARIRENMMQEKAAEYLMDKCNIEEKELPTKEEEREAEEQADKIIEEVEKTAQKIEQEDEE
ncbi:MAG: trigger factor [Thermotogota bacterium]|nr:trigger factor [Thermotogota bacterium]